jgi:hypothetical protein
MSDGDISDFWPFDGGYLTGDYGIYDFSEFLVPVSKVLVR